MNYRYYAIFCAIILFSTFSAAQNEILNSGFENWTNGEPENWVTTNIPGLVTTISESNDANSGNSSLKGEIGSFQGNPFGPGIQASQGFGVPILNITQNYTQLTGYYKVNVTPGTVVVVISNLSDGNFGLVASIIDTLPASATSWQQFTLDYDYSNTSGEQAITATLQIALGSDGAGFQIGDFFLLDDIALINPVGIEPVDNAGVATEFLLSQNYPNPFNPTTNIRFSLGKSGHASLIVYDLLGKEVARIVDEQLAAGSYVADWNATSLPSGTYFYTLTANGKRQSRKLMLLK